jgi:hypothetical protein
VWEDNRQNQEKPKARILTNATTQDTWTIATNNSGLSADQQTITTMMTQITQQFKEMERDRIVREDRQEMKRQEREAKVEEKRAEREARIEEKRVDAQREMYSFMQTMMMINQNGDQEKRQRKEAIHVPDELTTGMTEQTSAITTSIITTASTNTPTGKRSSSLLSNTDEETTMTEEGTEIEAHDTTDDAMSIKRNKTLTVNGEEKVDDETGDEEETMMDTGQQENTSRTNGTATGKDGTIIDQGDNSSSFTTGFNNQQFKRTTSSAPWPGVSKQ